MSDDQIGNLQPGLDVGGAERSTWRAKHLVASILFCLTFFFMGYRAGIGSASHCLGMFLPLAILVAILCQRLIPLGDRSQVKILVALVLIALGTTGSLLSYQLNTRNTKLMAANLRQQCENLISGVGNSGSSGTIDTRPRSTGDLGKAEQVVLTFLSEVAGLRRDYEQALGSIKFDTLLLPSRLAADKSFAESRSMLAKAEAIEQRAEQRHLAMVRGMRERMERIDISPSSKQQMLRGFDQTYSQTVALAERTWELERTLIVDMSAMIDILDYYKGKWSVTKGQILFTSDKGLADYNSAYDTLQQDIAEQERFTNVALDRARQHLNSVANTP